MPESGWLCEVFSGIQGEGLLIGERQIFIRLAGCNLSCAYCDTPHARLSSNVCRVEQTPGTRDFVLMDNPLTHSAVVRFAARMEKLSHVHHSAAITGGEPLVQPGFVENAARELKKKGFSVLLETNGSLPDALPNILPHVDVISMDIKLPSATGGPDLLHEHRSFLERAASVEVYVKIVLTADTSTAELLTAAEIVQGVGKEIPLVLQPVTPRASILPPSPAQVLDWQAQCRSYLKHVRVIPQCHKLMGQL